MIASKDTLTLAGCQNMDAEDPLASCRQHFQLPAGLHYLDGNSLGPMPRRTAHVLRTVAEEQWAGDLISSWNKHGWISLPERVGAKIARLLGAHDDEVIVADSTSINIFKIVSAALDLRPDRGTIVAERASFPTDLYVLEGLLRVRGSVHRLVLVDDAAALASDGEGADCLSDAAVVLLNHVNYATGRMLDLSGVTAAVQAGGALAIWDLAHSAGAVPVDLNAANVDFAVGCGYKFLNGGPGAPAFLYVARRHQAAAVNPLSGWFGHENAFAFETSYEPAAGIRRFLCGTPSILAVAALEVGVDILLLTDQAQLRKKSLALGELFLALLNQECGEWAFRLRSPAESQQRGSQINICHPEGYAITQALIRRGVVGDFRAPDVIRLGFAPLYTRYQDIWHALQHLRHVMHGREWDAPEFRVQRVVT